METRAVIPHCPRCNGRLFWDAADEVPYCISCGWLKPPDDPLPLVPNARFSGQRGKDAKGTEE